MAITARYVTAGGTDTYANSTNPATPMSLTTAFANMAAGDEIWVKKGNYTARATDTPTPDGTGPSPIIFHGYNATTGDLDTPTYNTDGSLVTSDYPVIEYNAAARLSANGADRIIWRNLRVGVAGAGFSGAAMIVGADCVVHQCYVYNPSTNAAAVALSIAARSIVENSDFALTGASGGTAALQLSNVATKVVNNRIIDSQTVGITAVNMGCVIVDNVFFQAVVGPCIAFTTATASHEIFIRGNTIQGKATGFQGPAVSLTTPSYFGDNHITDMSAAAILSLQDATAQVPGWFSHNRFRDNTVNVDGYDDWFSGSNIATVTTDTGGAATDYVDTTTNQYGLISAAPGVGKATVPNRDIGALQRSPAGSGGGSSPIGLGSPVIRAAS